MMNAKQISAAAATGLVVVVALVWWLGRKEYPEVSSPQNLQLMRALYTACSSRSEVRLAAVEREVHEADAAGRLTVAERQAFASIIALAHDDDWQRAADESYRFARDQVR